ncbi:MAG TPA: GIY-YIG nuclease family protein [Xanthomonadaceae bacterium]|nr:GIY-YIG nuclease family protein [Xanthomonadaceae bacterium]
MREALSFRSGTVPSRGRCFLYVFPGHWEDLLKLGISRDPLQRIRTLHPRWFGFFDLDAGWLVELERVREARALELSLRHALAEHRAVAPLTVREAAGGHTEWLRGAGAALRAEADALRARGHRLHAPLREWLRGALDADSQRLFAWSQAMLDAGVLEDPSPRANLRQAVRDALDACTALGIALEDRLPERVWAWYRR